MWIGDSCSFSGWTLLLVGTVGFDVTNLVAAMALVLGIILGATTRFAIIRLAFMVSSRMRGPHSLDVVALATPMELLAIPCASLGASTWVLVSPRGIPSFTSQSPLLNLGRT